MYSETAQIAELIDAATTIVIAQADNPDGDSLASALALEAILGDLGKQPALYCGIDMPAHLRYLPGWDRVENELPRAFDLTIIVDTSAASLFEQAQKTGDWQRMQQRPRIVLDHHNVEATLAATVICNQPVVATGELIYELAQQLGWPLSPEAAEALTVSILSDSLGLMTEATSPRSIQIISELVARGVKLPALEERRRLLNRKSPELVRYKGELLQRVQYHANDRVATVVIPWEEIERYSSAYNPSILVMDDMRMTTDTAVAVAFKVYSDGKITGKIRCNYGSPVAAALAEHFSGGGHIYASGFKIKDGRSIDQIKQQFVARATELLDTHGAHDAAL